MLKNLNVWTVMTFLLVSFVGYAVLNDTSFEVPKVGLEHTDRLQSIITFQYFCVIVALLGTLITSFTFVYLIFKGNVMDKLDMKKRAFQMLPILFVSVFFVVLGKFFAAEIINFVYEKFL